LCLLTTKDQAQSHVTSCDKVALFCFPLLIIISPLLRTHVSLSLRCVIAPTRQSLIITSLIFRSECSTLTHHWLIENKEVSHLLTQIHTRATNFGQISKGVQPAVCEVVAIYWLMACLRMQNGCLVDCMDNVSVCVQLRNNRGTQVFQHIREFRLQLRAEISA
jgi:hypothetical protein